MSNKKRLLTALSFAVLWVGVIVLPAQAQDAVSDLFGRINSLRTSLGLAPYSLNGSLTAAAMNQAQWMANTGEISHTQSDGSTPSSRAAAAGYSGRWVSENIYAGSIAGVGDAWNFWLNSPIHYRGMTNPNYQEIGIATASGGGWGQSFVLVFGSPGGSEAYIPPSSSGGGGSVSSGPPPYVVGLDSHGNIMHEVQEDQTIGDILLIYGYTWGDLPYFLNLNTKTQDDIRSLQVGEIVLVPPQAGTYTPTAPPADWPTNTPEPDDFVSTAIAKAAAEATQTALVSPAPTQTPIWTMTAVTEQTAVSVRRIVTAAGVPVILETATPIPTLNLQPDVTLTPTLVDVTQIASLSTPAPLIDITAPAPPTQIPWVWIAVGVQIGVALAAGIQYFRRRK